ncbi:hypothetical protein B5G52_12985 [Pseudoalteromonas sp. A601]|uniref:hypothetical protein n=1 Tax=Pseudoalteromonas sp. A601 TaxID=1967839 RepID=UPI000B3D2CD2|nr:hypothetical protein [Pseudoalteromonas sp. A601]OUS70854.1 hypothetical protein B5G52_12985 [Pseudoalteromonas sp. A601]
MQLSRKAWNNVLIFSMLLMIFFFNGLHKKLNSVPEQPSIQTLLPAQSFILALSFPEQKVERIGTAWRSLLLLENPTSSEWSANQENIVKLINDWQGAELSVSEVSPAKLTQPITVATLWLAGEQLPWLYQLYSAPQGYYLLDKSTQRVFLIDANKAQQLFVSFEFLPSESN